MIADIVEFPYAARQSARLPPRGVQVKLIKSWDDQFFNPYLNAIYDNGISYIERWYLETRSVLQNESKSNLLNQLMLDKEFCKEFIKAIDYDLNVLLDLLNSEDKAVAIRAENLIKKLRSWRGNFLYCLNR